MIGRLGILPGRREERETPRNSTKITQEIPPQNENPSSARANLALQLLNLDVR